MQLVTGKGGTGKSTFAAAVALAGARAGKRVLAIEMGAPAGLAALLGARPEAHGVPVPIATGLHLAYFDGEACLAEYLRKRLRLGRLVDTLTGHPLYRAFVEAGPGVRELMAIGKVRDEMLGLSSGTPRWDLLVVDAGASGHAIQLLRMPGATARTFSSGLAHREAARVAGALADPATTAIHVVALPEEMPLKEAAETVERIAGELGLPIGRVVVNQCRSPAPPGVAGALGVLRAGGRAGKGVAAMAERELGWLEIQEDGIAALERRVGMRVERLPRLEAEPLGRPELEKLAALVG